MPSYVLIIITLGMICITALAIAFVYHTHKTNEENIRKHELNVISTIDSSIPNILDTIINTIFEDYKIKNLLSINTEYIKEEQETKIRNDLIKLVSDRISRDALDKVSLFYNKDHIPDVIADKVYICVMNYVVKNNNAYVGNHE